MSKRESAYLNAKRYLSRRSGEALEPSAALLYDLFYDYRELMEAAGGLRRRQKDYLSGPKDQRSEEKGKAVGVAAERLDWVMAKALGED